MKRNLKYKKSVVTALFRPAPVAVVQPNVKSHPKTTIWSYCQFVFSAMQSTCGW